MYSLRLDLKMYFIWVSFFNSLSQMAKDADDFRSRKQVEGRKKPIKKLAVKYLCIVKLARPHFHTFTSVFFASSKKEICSIITKVKLLKV